MKRYILIDRETFLKRIFAVATYLILYLIGFHILEGQTTDITIIHTTLDDKIPFISAFIVPYMMWFAFVAWTVGYFLVTDCEGEDFRKLVVSLAIGCTIFLLTSALFPNGQDFRPHLAGSDIFQQMTLWLYSIDTPTNIFPSIHVFNSLICCVSILQYDRLKKRPVVCWGTVCLTVLIVLATMFLKQHSVVDVVGAMIMFLLCYRFIYVRVPDGIPARVGLNR